MPTNMNLVLQMPRGNLEGVCPRIIMLTKVIEDIEDGRYGQAFRLLRTHKIDINLMYDVNPARFLGSVAKFVAERVAALDVRMQVRIATLEARSDTHSVPPRKARAKAP